MIWQRVPRLRVDEGGCRLEQRIAACALVLLGIVAHVRPASALDFTCIESSKYKYVSKLFGDNSQQFSSYFTMGSNYVPPAEACRAGLVSGHVDPKDGEKALQFVSANRGWLATLYLATGGGSVKGGVRVALVTRMFWLKTIVVPGKSFRYAPDFAIPPADRSANTPVAAAWRAFDAASQDAAAEKVSYAKCASACTFILAAGIDRNGLANVHRPHTRQDTSLETVEQRLERAEATMVAIYRHMDAGPTIEDYAHSTATQTVTPKVMSRYPRFIEDTLLKKCKSDVAQLDDVRHLLDWSLAQDKDLPAGLIDASALQSSLDKVDARTRLAEQCVAGYQEHERVDKYNQHCANGCAVDSLSKQVDEQAKKLIKE